MFNLKSKEMEDGIVISEGTLNSVFAALYFCFSPYLDEVETLEDLEKLKEDHSWVYEAIVAYNRLVLDNPYWECVYSCITVENKIV